MVLWLLVPLNLRMLIKTGLAGIRDTAVMRFGLFFEGRVVRRLHSVRLNVNEQQILTVASSEAPQNLRPRKPSRMVQNIWQ